MLSNKCIWLDSIKHNEVIHRWCKMLRYRPI